MRTLLRDSAAGLMHSMIYFGFLVLLGVTTVLEIDHQVPPALKFLHGDVYRAYAAVGDIAGIVFTGVSFGRSFAAMYNARTAFVLSPSQSTPLALEYSLQLA